MLLLIEKNLYKDKTKIENTKSLTFRYTVGNYINADIVYELYLINNSYIATYKIAGIPKENQLKKEVSKETVTKIENILKKYKVYKWNGFNKSDNNVLDGNSFSFSYTNTNKKYISASGYMKYPKNYRNFKNDINSLYEELFKEEIKIQKATLR